MQGVDSKEALEFWRVKVGMNLMGQFKADMGLDWTDIRVRAFYNHLCKPFYCHTLIIFFTAINIKVKCLLYSGKK
jgi:hypothetical protein